MNNEEKYSYLTSDEKAKCVIAEIKARCLGYGEGVDNDILTLIESYERYDNIFQTISWLTGKYFR